MLEIAELKLLARFECNFTSIIPPPLESQTKATPLPYMHKHDSQTPLPGFQVYCVFTESAYPASTK